VKIKIFLAAIALAVSWLWGTRYLALFVDRFLTIKMGEVPLDPVRVPEEYHSFLAAGNQVSFTKERSLLVWPTPFRVNFMTGRTPSWERWVYYRLVARKPSGEQIDLLWRYLQPYYPPDGWLGDQTNESTGLIKIVQD
jgi:hypothetical protein